MDILVCSAVVLQHLLVCWCVPRHPHTLPVCCRAFHQAPHQEVPATATPARTAQAPGACSDSCLGPTAANGLLWWDG